jgi:hypothetical protein
VDVKNAAASELRVEASGGRVVDNTMGSGPCFVGTTDGARTVCR